ncbi:MULTISPECIES: hypothetical protein [unclassified Microcoleus]|uniref:hypothetical protein n=1 Tax=unclassified Microcoleus TaxID=2642155 RepID=UPI002FD64BC9
MKCLSDIMSVKWLVITHMLHDYQLGFYEQAFRPVKRENLSFVERAGEPVFENGARCE